MPARNRPDKDGTHRGAFEKNKRKIYATRTICGICGKPVDMSLRWPNPMSKCIDHIIPVSKGGHPSDIDNLQLAHMCCNREKSDKIFKYNKSKSGDIENELVAIGNRNLPQNIDWVKYCQST